MSLAGRGYPPALRWHEFAIDLSPLARRGKPISRGGITVSGNARREQQGKQSRALKESSLPDRFFASNSENEQFQRRTNSLVKPIMSSHQFFMLISHTPKDKNSYFRAIPNMSAINPSSCRGVHLGVSPPNPIQFQKVLV